MKRVLKLSSEAESLLQKTPSPSSTKPKTLIPHFPNPQNSRFIVNRVTSHTAANTTTTKVLSSITDLFTRKYPDDHFFLSQLHSLSQYLITNQSHPESINKILDTECSFLIQNYRFAFPSIKLLSKLKSYPHLSLQVFNWRKNANVGVPMVPEEYAKGITIAGRLKNLDLAVNLFTEACSIGFKTTSVYNALMGAYMCNDKPWLSQAVFQDLKGEITCRPTIVSYNIMLTVFGRLTYVEKMEGVIRELVLAGIPPNVSTYNHIIAGYICEWNWDKMERTFEVMQNSPVMPNLDTHFLMLKGYANSGNLHKMEETYDYLKLHGVGDQPPMIITMICAYCKSSGNGRVAKVETLLKLISEKDYRPWLNVVLIRLYAQEELLDGMENLIRQAFEHNTSVMTVGVMRAIITTYYRCNAITRFTNFLKRAEFSGWRICRSLYHCKMVMCSTANRLEEMENVIEEMSRYNLAPTKKTFLIMYKAYSKWGQRYRRDKLLGTMCKHGVEIPSVLDSFAD